MSSNIQPASLPENALLRRYSGSKNLHAYTDCYSMRLDRQVGLAEFVEAFYTGAVFKLERFILGVLVAKPSTDAQAGELAQGETDSFSAWLVEARTTNQLLLCDFRGTTRSWLMVQSTDNPNQTTLYFGSAVIYSRNSAAADRKPSIVFRLLSGFHRLYSKVLLASAHRKLIH